jgi:hypothetical protein
MCVQEEQQCHAAASNIGSPARRSWQPVARHGRIARARGRQDFNRRFDPAISDCWVRLDGSHELPHQFFGVD